MAYHAYPWPVAVLACLALLVAAAPASLGGDLAWSDPARLPPAPAGAAGYPSRGANLDALPGFAHPPAGYGEVAFYWWLGDPLTRERLSWQLDLLRDKGITGLQVNYAHCDKGGRSYGLTYASDPPLFSKTWWDLFDWFVKEAKKRGMAVSLSDYTLGTAGQGWFIDEMLRDNPEMGGQVLAQVGRDVVPKRVPLSLDPMHPLSGRKLIEKFFQRFEDHSPGEGGKGLNCFFSDELTFGVRGWLWTADFASEFRKRKGYDVTPELAALFADVGPRTPKVRLDFSDVMVALEEERFFRPVFEWHRSRGMLYGCDHGGRGTNVVEFGDYFRTQRWMTGPGNDQPHLASDVIRDKVGASIAHLYQRPRNWLEGYYGSGWGTTPAQVADATFRNFAMGMNLLTLHGLYYSTHSGWWEWAPPCNHFRMPYWAHMGQLLRCTERLSYVLSQGFHRCDVAILYPVAPMEAGMGGKESVDAAFGTGRALYPRGIDFDFMDFESLTRAEVRDRQLQVSGEAYRALVLPAMRAVRHSTVQKALEFFRGGGLVIAVGDLPQASDRVGRNDAELDGMVREIFGADGRQPAGREPSVQRHASGGRGVRVQTAAQVAPIVDEAFTRDFRVVGAAAEAAKAPTAYVLHRKVGPRDLYMVYNVPKHTDCFFRARGKVELWDPWTGGTQPLHVWSEGPAGTTVRMPLEATQPQLIVFSPGETPPAVERTDLGEVLAVEATAGSLAVRGLAATAGRKTATVRAGGKVITLTGEAPAPPPAKKVEGDWEFELKPTLDNRWGDFRWPPSNQRIGAEARQVLYADEPAGAAAQWQSPQFNDSKWARVTCSFGPRFWKLGPLPDDAATAAIEAELAALTRIDPATPVRIAGKTYAWQPYAFSMRWGIENDPGHQGYHGLKEEVSDEFIGLGKLRTSSTASAYEKEAAGSRYYLWSSAISPRAGEATVLAGGMKPAAIWLNNAGPCKAPASVTVKAGANPVLIRYDGPGRGSVIFHAGRAETPAPSPTRVLSATNAHNDDMAMTWYNLPGVLPYDLRPEVERPAGWYRFTSPPGLRAMTVVARGQVQAWADGRPMAIGPAKRRDDGAGEHQATAAQVSPHCVKVAVRIEQERGCYGGSALGEPIALDCQAGLLAPGDWSKVDGLASYSGGAWYRKTVSLAPEDSQGRVVLDLGEVAASAEVHVNGHAPVVCVAPPWRLDISEFVRSGENRIEILVYNALANHYSTIPTRYRGSPVSGLLGPVRIEVAAPVTLKAAN